MTNTYDNKFNRLELCCKALYTVDYKIMFTFYLLSKNNLTTNNICCCGIIELWESSRVTLLQSVCQSQYFPAYSKDKMTVTDPSLSTLYPCYSHLYQISLFVLFMHVNLLIFYSFLVARYSTTFVIVWCFSSYVASVCVMSACIVPVQLYNVWTMY